MRGGSSAPHDGPESLATITGAARVSGPGGAEGRSDG
jgi:hypothetical protein